MEDSILISNILGFESKKLQMQIKIREILVLWCPKKKWRLKK